MKLNVINNSFDVSSNSLDLCVNIDNSVVQRGTHERVSELKRSAVLRTTPNKGVGDRCVTNNRQSFPVNYHNQPQLESQDSFLYRNGGKRKREESIQDATFIDKRKCLNQTAELMVSVDDEGIKNNTALKRKRSFASYNSGCDFVSETVNKKQKVIEGNASIKSDSGYNHGVQSCSNDKKVSFLRKIKQCGVSIAKSIYPAASYFVPFSAVWVEALLGGRLKPDFSDVAKHIDDCGPFVRKIGQLFASDVRIPMEKRKDLMHLCNDNAPEPFEYIEQKVNEDCKKLGFDVIYIDPKPLGSGVTAQVHKVKIKVKGRIEEYAVKIVRKGIVDKLDADYKDVVFALSKLYSVFKNDIGVILESISGFYDYAEVFEKSMTKQVMDQLLINLKNESSMINEFKMMELYKRGVESVGNGLFKVPEGIGATEDILVMEYINGDTVSDLMAKGCNKKANAIYSKSCQVWKDVLKSSGLLHGDLHPGNLMLEKNRGGEKIVFLDFGAVLDNCRNIGDIGLFSQLLKRWLELEQSEGFMYCENPYLRERYIEDQTAPEGRAAESKLIAEQFKSKKESMEFNTLLDNLYNESKGCTKGNLMMEMIDLYKSCFNHYSRTEEEIKNNFIGTLSLITSTDGHGSVNRRMRNGGELFKKGDDLSNELFAAFIKAFSSFATITIKVELCYYLQCQARICEFEKNKITDAKQVRNETNIVENKSEECLVKSTSEKNTLRRNAPKKNYRKDLVWMSLYNLNDDARAHKFIKHVEDARKKFLPRGSLFSDNVALDLEFGNHAMPNLDTTGYLKSKLPDDPRVFESSAGKKVETSDKKKGSSDKNTDREVSVKKHRFLSINVDELSPSQFNKMIKGIEDEQKNNKFSSGTRFEFLQWWGLDYDRRGRKKVYTESEICSLYLNYLRSSRSVSLIKQKKEVGIMHAYGKYRTEQIAAFRMGLR
ncbi:MAG: AarF/UbiB family protein [Candidatus Endonucleobacter sp. (ex Gigantidas childressi)]|nr:AarF/UbiB family protein [Candidatus Endonucleobacter sp. (ex Gigantidas childressi)]